MKILQRIIALFAGKRQKKCQPINVAPNRVLEAKNIMEKPDKTERFEMFVSDLTGLMKRHEIPAVIGVALWEDSGLGIIKNCFSKKKTLKAISESMGEKLLEMFNEAHIGKTGEPIKFESMTVDAKENREN